jgi:hypothetical protein
VNGNNGHQIIEGTVGCQDGFFRQMMKFLSNLRAKVFLSAMQLRNNFVALFVDSAKIDHPHLP